GSRRADYASAIVSPTMPFDNVERLAVASTQRRARPCRYRKVLATVQGVAGLTNLRLRPCCDLRGRVAQSSVRPNVCSAGGTCSVAHRRAAIDFPSLPSRPKPTRGRTDCSSTSFSSRTAATPARPSYAVLIKPGESIWIGRDQY